VKPKRHKRTEPRRNRPVTDRELDRWGPNSAPRRSGRRRWRCGGLPEGVPLPERPGEVVAIFFRRKAVADESPECGRLHH